MNTQILLTDIEAAINYWRRQKPSVGEELRLCLEASVLANHYALMIVQHHHAIAWDALDARAQQAIEGWRQSLGTSA